jgi:hypothetical protein
MISVIIEGGPDGRELAALLAALVPAAVDGLVREVIVVDAEPSDPITAICEDAGAEPAADLGQAVRQAKADLLLLLPQSLRLRSGWDESVRRHLEGRGAAALLCEADTGWLGRFVAPRTAGVLAPKDRFVQIAPVGVDDMRRRLARLPRLS